MGKTSGRSALESFLGCLSMSHSSSICKTRALVASLIASLLGFAVGQSREAQILWQRNSLRYWIVNNPVRPSGGRDYAMVEALEALGELRALGADRVARSA